MILLLPLPSSTSLKKIERSLPPTFPTSVLRTLLPRLLYIKHAERFVALWQEVARCVGTERSSRLLVPVRGRGNFHYSKTSSVSPRVVFSGSWQRWRILEREGKGLFQRDRKPCLLPRRWGKGRGERKSCVSLSPWISSLVCYLLTELLLTAYLSSKESEFILVLPFLFSFL